MKKHEQLKSIVGSENELGEFGKFVKQVMDRLAATGMPAEAAK